MKKLLIALLIALSLPLQTLAITSFKAATLYKGDARVAVYNKADADALFAKGFKLEQNILGYSVVTAYSTTLSQSMTATQTTVPVSSLSTKDGHTLTMADLGTKVFLTIEPGSAKEEIVMCTTISGTAWATCTRGLAFYGTGVTAVTANQKTHASGSRVVMSNVHYVYEQLTDIDTDQTIAGIKTFTSLPLIPTSTPTLDAQAVSFYQFQQATTTGGVNGSETQKGVWEGASQAEMIVGTQTGSSGADLVLQNKYATSTPSSTTTIPITGVTGKLSTGFIDQTANYTWSGANTYSGTSTFSGNINGNGSVNTFATTTFSGLTKVPTSTPTVAGQVVGLDSSAKLPAVDGSQLTNKNSAFFLSRMAAMSPGSDQYLNLLSATGTVASTESGAQSPFPAMTISKMIVTVITNSLSAVLPVTLRKNGSDTALTLNVAAGSTSATSTSSNITVANGDLLAIKFTNPGGSGSIANVIVSFLANLVD